MYDESKLLEAIWQNPDACTGLHFEKKGSCWQTRQRPDGSEDTHPYTILKQAADGHTIFVNYNGAQYAGGNIWELLKLQYNTNDFSDVITRTAECYGITPEYKYQSEQQQRRAEQRRAEADVIEAMAKYLLQQLNTDEGAAAREYLQRRGLKPSPRIGAYSKAIRGSLITHLRERFKNLNSEQITAIVQRNLPAKYPDDYAVVIPYYNGSNKVTGFCQRLTTTQITYTDEKGAEQKKRKQQYSYGENNGGTFAKGGYCLNLSREYPVIMVEGEIDAEAMRQAAEDGGEAYSILKNTIAVGGMTPTDNEEDAYKSQIKTLQRFGVKQLVYLPDFEYDAAGRLKTDATRRTIAAILPHLTQEQTGQGFISLNVVQLYNRDGSKEKQDADSFVRSEGADALKAVIETAEPWYKWQLRDDVANNEGNADALAAAAVATYCSIASYTNREIVRRLFADASAEPYIEALKKAGISASVLNYIDANGYASTWRQRMTSQAAKLNTSLQENATQEEVGKILAEANRIQNLRIGDSFAAQVNTTQEQIHAAVKAKPEPLQTCWTMYAHRKDGTAYPVRKISFTPAAVSIVAAPSNHGKTLFLLQTCLYLAKTTKKHFIYLSTENDADQLYIRALAANIGYKWKDATDDRNNPITYPRQEIRAYIKSEDAPKVIMQYDVRTASRKELNLQAEEKEYWQSVAPFVSLLRIGTDVDAICNCITAQVEAWKANGEEVGGIFIDYLQQLRTNGRTYSRTDEVKGICESLNDLSKALAVPVIAAAQLNRDATKAGGEKLDGVELANIGESSGIENIAEDVYLLWQVDKINPDSAEYNSANGFKLQVKHYRTRRCFDSDTDSTKRKDGHLYVENLKARDYAGGAYCLLPYFGAAGSIHTTDKTAIFTDMTKERNTK